LAAVKDVIMPEKIMITAMTDNQQGLVNNLGEVLFTKYVLPFEVSSILFISAMVGAILLAKREKQIID